jgi:HAD superfamily hydrolase (TIGR01549 family)
LTIKAVIFDLDGTLVEFKLDYKTERAELMQWLTDQGIPASILSTSEGMFETLKKAETYMRNTGKKAKEIDRVKEAVLSLADRYELQAAGETNLVPGVLEALNALRDMKLKMSLFTIDGERATSFVLRRFRIGHFFDAVITRDVVSAVKPDPAHLKAALEALNVKPYEALVVGDSTLDMRCARAYSVLAVGVTTGISTPERLMDAGASYLASSSAEIPILVQQLNRRS